MQQKTPGVSLWNHCKTPRCMYAWSTGKNENNKPFLFDSVATWYRVICTRRFFRKSEQVWQTADQSWGLGQRWPELCSCFCPDPVSLEHLSWGPGDMIITISNSQCYACVPLLWHRGHPVAPRAFLIDVTAVSAPLPNIWDFFVSLIFGLGLLHVSSVWRSMNRHVASVCWNDMFLNA